MVYIPGEREAMSTLHKLAVLLLPLLVVMLAARLGTAQPESKSEPEPDCLKKCGELNIPYPFGIREGCYLNDNFLITCNDTENIPYLRRGNLRVLNISFDGELEVSNWVTYACYSKSGEIVDYFTSWLEGTSRFPISYTRNKFTVVGCDTFGLITGSAGYRAGCTALCDDTQYLTNGSCSGIGCCQTTIPQRVTDYNLSMVSFSNQSGVWDFNPCGFAFVVKEEGYNFSTAHLSNLSNIRRFPVVLNWAIGDQTCEEAKINVSSIYVCGNNTECYNSNNRLGYLCICIAGYEGNPYLENGCQDIDECKISNSCNQTCHNLPGGYNCSCPEGYEGDGRIDGTGCSLVPNKKFPFINIALGTSTGLGVLFLLVATWWSRKILKRRKKTKLKEKFFKRNGGLLLQQQLSSGEGNVEKTKLFTAKELEKATDHYNENRVLGQGGQGTVYKGMLTDGRIVAVKKSKLVDETKLEQFINEVVILSQINHRNVVKLHGCCLETQVPLLVYEFVPNGTLYQYIHDQNEEFPLSWNMRARIAAEIAGALSYLHSAASIPIFHRDIKSTNILLDDKYRAKVSDFGTSRSIAIDQTHLTTQVQGTFGYLDPEYFQSSQFTEKSDVYSFGVVLVELLTGQKPISLTRSEERSLATYFIMTVKENHLFDILDAQVLKEGGKEEIMGVASLAKRCLNLNGRKRPTMKEVAMELEGIRMSHGAPASSQQICEEVEYKESELDGSWDGGSTLTGSSSEKIFSSSQPLLKTDR